MAERIPPPLSPAARDLLRAFADDESPSTRQRDVGLSSLQTRLETTAPAANGSLYIRVITTTLAVAAAVLLLIKGIGAGVTALADNVRQPAMEAPYLGEDQTSGGQASSRAPKAIPAARPRSSKAPAAAVVVEESPAPEAPAATPEPVRPRSVATPKTPAPAPSADTAADPATDLAAELRLIKKAQKAMQQGRHAQGLAALDKHTRDFPRGVLVDERTVLQAELLCAAGREDAARAKAKRFLARHSGSALAGRMRAVCAEPTR